MLSIFGNSNSGQRSIFLFDAIGSWSSESVISRLISLDKESDDPINIFINSPGGSVSDGFAIIDVMNAMASPVNTIVLGKAASCGSLISSQRPRTG